MIYSLAQSNHKLRVKLEREEMYELIRLAKDSLLGKSEDRRYPYRLCDLLLVVLLLFFFVCVYSIKFPYIYFFFCFAVSLFFYTLIFVLKLFILAFLFLMGEIPF